MTKEEILGRLLKDLESPPYNHETDAKTLFRFGFPQTT